MKFVFCCPTYTRPFDQFIKAMEDSVPLLNSKGIDHGMTFEVGSAYISRARADMLRRALDARADYIVFLDHDLSWTPEALLKLLETPGDCIAGTYRFKQEKERYMGLIYQIDRAPCTRWPDGAIEADRVPAGFLKISKEAVDLFMEKWPELSFGPRYSPTPDIFNHGAYENDWWGEDYSFSRRYREAGGQIWLVPDLDITHHDNGGVAYPGNFHNYLIKERTMPLDGV